MRASRDGWGGLVLVIGLLAVVTAIWGLPLLLALFLILAMLFLHELGHFLTARSAGMKVTEFFLGFGPRLWSFRRGETVYGLKAIPFGAYVRIIGMNNLEQVPPADEHRTYRSKPYWRRMSVAVAGSTMHFLLALILIFCFLVVGGRTESVPSSDWTVSQVVPGSPAHGAGLMPGDRIVSVNGSPVATMDDMVGLLPDPGTPVSLGVEREDEVLARTLTLGTHPQDSSRGYIGIGSLSAWSYQPVEIAYLEAVPETFEQFGFIVRESVYGIGRVFSPGGLSNFFQRVAEQPAGPEASSVGGPTGFEAGAEDGDRVVSILGVLQLFSDFISDITEDYPQLLLLFALVNIFIGVFNMIPLLPFDGGHVAIATYERLRSRRGRRYTADVSKMVPVAYAVVLVLIFVGIGALYLDAADPPQLPG
ncbi:MAG: M50 family metallopeptidase [bacterium]|nr:M50 family metallopeptidase [bacterium]